MKPCGTEAAYQRHFRRGEPPCDPCREAAAAYRRKFPRKRPEKAWRVRDDLLDRLTVDGGWLTADILAAESGRNVDTVKRVLRRLRDDGLVVSRVVALAYATRNSVDSRMEWRRA